MRRGRLLLTLAAVLTIFVDVISGTARTRRQVIQQVALFPFPQIIFWTWFHPKTTDTNLSDTFELNHFI
jgi:hypothetical protein